MQEGEREPHDRIRRQRIGRRAQRAGHDRGQDERHRAEARCQPGNVRPRDQHADRPGGGDDTDGEVIRALPFERERHQRQRDAGLQADGGAGGENGNEGTPGAGRHRFRASRRHADVLRRARTPALQLDARPRRRPPAGGATCRHKGHRGPAARHDGHARRRGRDRGR